MFAGLHQLSHNAAWRRQLEMLLESAGEGIYGIDLGGRCIFINGTGAAMLGYSPDEVLGRNMHYLMHHSRSDGQLMAVAECRIFRAFRDGEGCRVDDEVLWRRDGSQFAAEYASYPIRNGETVVGAVVTFSDITARKRTEAALQAAHDQLEGHVAARTAELSAANQRLQQAQHGLRRLSAHLNTVREEERAHIARDIHDDLGASFAAMQLELNWMRQRLGPDPALHGAIDRMLEMAGTAMGALRRILNDLRPGVLDHLGLWAALECLLQETQLRSGLRCIYDCSAELERCRLGRQAEIAIYRIVQELVTNVLRHAAASTLCLQASAAGRELSIRVRDDGRGMQQPAPPSGFGLLGVRERALALGGSVDIVSSPGAGSEICLRLPGAIA